MPNKDDTLAFYHGTDLDSALNILNDGLQSQPLVALQSGRPVDLGRGWYTTMDAEVAWYFAPLAPGNIARGCTVIEMEITKDDFEHLVKRGDVIQAPIQNVLFVAEQYLFKPNAFDYLNAHAVFRPHKG